MQRNNKDEKKFEDYEFVDFEENRKKALAAMGAEHVRRRFTAEQLVKLVNKHGKEIAEIIATDNVLLNVLRQNHESELKQWAKKYKLNSLLVEETQSNRDIADYDLSFRIKLLGSSGVGKSCTILQYADHVYHEGYISSIGCDFKIRNIDVDGRKVKLEIWDTEQGRFRTIPEDSTRGASAVIIMFSVTDMVSFLNAKQLVDRCISPGRMTYLYLVGNKIDLEGRRIVENQTAKDFAADCGIPYMEISAKKGENVNEIFSTIAENEIKRRKLTSQKENNERLTRFLKDRYVEYYSSLDNLNRDFQLAHTYFKSHDSHPLCSHSEWIKIWGEVRKQACKILEEEVNRCPQDATKIINEAKQKYKELLLGHRTSGIMGLMNAFRSTKTEAFLNDLAEQASKRQQRGGPRS